MRVSRTARNAANAAKPAALPMNLRSPPAVISGRRFASRLLGGGIVGLNLCRFRTFGRYGKLLKGVDDVRAIATTTPIQQGRVGNIGCPRKSRRAHPVNGGSDQGDCLGNARHTQETTMFRNLPQATNYETSL